MTMSDQRRRSLVVLAGWMVLLTGTVGVLHLVGRGPLATPPVTRPGDLAGWLGQRSPTILAFGFLRLAAMGLAWYLLATTLAGLVARMCGQARWSAAVDAVSPAAIRRVLQGAAGLTVATAVTSAQSAAWASPRLQAAPGGQPAPIMRRLPSAPVPASDTGPQVTADTTAPTMRAGPAGDGGGTPAPTPPPATAPPATWIVRPGDNLWSVAESTLARAWHRAPSDTEVDTYWTGLIAANRVRLANRDDPDLVFPGQVFVLPPTPG
jgi:nucleoid-associated protein YgaU